MSYIEKFGSYEKASSMFEAACQGKDHARYDLSEFQKELLSYRRKNYIFDRSDLVVQIADEENKILLVGQVNNDTLYVAEPGQINLTPLGVNDVRHATDAELEQHWQSMINSMQEKELP